MYIFFTPFLSSSLVWMCRYYLFALILNLTRDVYELRLLVEREDHARAAKSCSSLHPNSTQSADHSLSSHITSATITSGLSKQLHLLVTVLYSNPPLLLDLLKNSCDIFIPMDRLGIYQTGPGFVGACGLASSILSILTMVHPWLKLKPWTLDTSLKAELKILAFNTSLFVDDAAADGLWSRFLTLQYWEIGAPRSTSR